MRTGVFHHWLTWRSFLSLLRSSLSGSVVSDASTYKNKPVVISHIFCKHNKIQSKTPVIISNHVLQNGDTIFSSTCNMQNWSTHSWSTDMYRLKVYSKIPWILYCKILHHHTSCILYVILLAYISNSVLHKGLMVTFQYIIKYNCLR